MKLSKILLISTIFVFAMSSCGGSSKSSGEGKTEENNKHYVMEPQTSSISGPLGKAFTVIERKYKANKDAVCPSINVEIELSDASKLPEGFDPKTFGSIGNEGNPQYSMLANFIIEFLDEDGDIIETKDQSSGADQLLQLAEGERGSLEFYLPANNLEDIRSFRIKSVLQSNEINTNKSTGNSLDDEEFDKAMEHTKEAMKTTSQALKVLKDIVE